MRAEDHRGASGDLCKVVHEHRALAAERLDDVAVVDDLVPHVQGGAVLLERDLDDLDRADNACAEASGSAEDDLHHIPSLYRGVRAEWARPL